VLVPISTHPTIYSTRTYSGLKNVSFHAIKLNPKMRVRLWCDNVWCDMAVMGV
jgi:hypothetical protein